MYLKAFSNIGCFILLQLLFQHLNPSFNKHEKLRRYLSIFLISSVVVIDLICLMLEISTDQNNKVQLL